MWEGGKRTGADRRQATEACLVCSSVETTRVPISVLYGAQFVVRQSMLSRSQPKIKLAENLRYESGNKNKILSKNKKLPFLNNYINAVGLYDFSP
jgi:hypothetical protein